MAELPDELWRRILKIGVSNPNPNRLTFKDLCSLSITSRRHNRLSNDHSLWSTLLSSDFPSNPNPNPNPNDSVKSMYKSRFEKDKARRIAAHKRSMLRVESRIAEHERRVVELRSSKAREAEIVNGALAELSELRKVRQASVALNVWQPEIIRGRQKAIVEQCPVPVESRINALEMELKLCKQQIMVFDKAYRDEKQRLEAAKEQLFSMKYHPLQDYSVINDRKVDSHCVEKRKLKQCTTDLRTMAIECLVLGAGQEVGKSCVLVNINGKKIMFDCGMHMGYHNHRRYPDFSRISKSGDFDNALSCIIITHLYSPHPFRHLFL